MVEQTAYEFPEDEAALYDRQIRLWGLDAQKRLRASRILVVGAQGLGVEVCKNVVLAGINSLTLLDSSIVSEEDCGSQFLIDASNDIGKNLADCSLAKIRQLNPNVNVLADSENVDSKTEEFFSNFDVVVLTKTSAETSVHVDNLCRRLGIKVVVADVFGLFGYAFFDLGHKHEYSDDTGICTNALVTSTSDKDVEPPHKKLRANAIAVKKSMSFISFEEALSSKWFDSSSGGNKTKSRIKRLQSTYVVLLVMNRFQADVGRRPDKGDVDALLKIRDTLLEEAGIEQPQSSSGDGDENADDYSGYCCPDLNAVCAIVGGVLAQEIIKAVSHKDKPHNNFFFFNGRFNELGGSVENMR